MALRGDTGTFVSLAELDVYEQAEKSEWKMRPGIEGGGGSQAPPPLSMSDVQQQGPIEGATGCQRCTWLNPRRILSMGRLTHEVWLCSMVSLH